MSDHKKSEFKVTEDILATLGQRFLNFAIDIIILSVLFFIGLVIYIGNNATTPEQGKEIMERLLSNSLWQFMLTSIVTLVYYNFFEILTSRTIGKFCTSTIVVDEQGNKASYEAIMFRSLVRIIPLYWISFLIAPTRGLHDVISKTYVVDKRKLAEKKKLTN